MSRPQIYLKRVKSTTHGKKLILMIFWCLVLQYGWLRGKSGKTLPIEWEIYLFIYDHLWFNKSMTSCCYMSWINGNSQRKMQDCSCPQSGNYPRFNPFAWDQRVQLTSWCCGFIFLVKRILMSAGYENCSSSALSAPQALFISSEEFVSSANSAHPFPAPNYEVLDPSKQ